MPSLRVTSPNITWQSCISRITLNTATKNHGNEKEINT